MELRRLKNHDGHERERGLRMGRHAEGRQPADFQGALFEFLESRHCASERLVFSKHQGFQIQL